MMPMRLWSTVVSQLVQPVVDWGRVKAPSGLGADRAASRQLEGAAVGRSTIAMSQESLVNRASARNATSWSIWSSWSWRLGMPRASGAIGFWPGGSRSQASRSVRLSSPPISSYSTMPSPSASTQRLNVPPANAPRVAKWVRSGASPATSVVPPSSSNCSSLMPRARWQREHWRGEELGAGRRLLVGGHLGLGLLVGEPLVELVLREGDGPLAHVGVRQAAELGALADVGAGLVGVEREVRRHVGDGVLLAVERRDPEGVDDVVGVDLQLDVDPGRDDQVGAGAHVVEVAVAVGVVVEPPPPLLALDLRRSSRRRRGC